MWTIRPHEGQYSKAAASMPLRGQHLLQAVRDSNQNGIEVLVHLDFHRRYFCCKPSTGKRTYLEYDPLAGFPLSRTVSRKVV